MESIPIQTMPQGTYSSRQNGDWEIPSRITSNTCPDRQKSMNSHLTTVQTFHQNPILHLLPGARIDPRPYQHKFFIRHPRLLQYYDKGELIDSRGHRLRSRSVDELKISRSVEGEVDLGGVASVHEHLVEHESEKSETQREWLNLFIDLLWAGIVSNISENFTSSAFEPGGSWGLGFVEFAVLFLAAFKIWNYLRKFLNNFFNKDYLQTIFIMWILILALFFGNQSPHFLEPGGGAVVIWTYLIAKYSFAFMEIVYAIFIPKLRRQLIITLIIAAPAAALWVGALRVTWPTRAALMLPALVLESLAATAISLPLGDWFLRGAPKKALDPDNYIERLQGFFIIILGEGLSTLIQGSSWGLGLSMHVGAGVMALMIFYSVFSLFFTGDGTRTYIHAVFRNRYTAVAFESIHVLLYASLLLLDASVRYLIETTFSDPTDDEQTASAVKDQLRCLYLARWTVSAALGMTLTCITAISLLNRSLDTPGTLLISNRYLRLAPRAIVVIVALLLPLKPQMLINSFLGLITGLLLGTLVWEYIASMEKGWRFIEPAETVESS